MNMTKEEILGEIDAMKQLLRNTDYMAIKFAEGEMSAEDYAGTKASRQHWRSTINEMEAALEEVERIEGIEL